MESDLTIDRLAGIKKYAHQFSQIGDDYLIARFDVGNSLLGSDPEFVRIHGIAMLFNVSGNLTVEYNTETHHVGPASLMVCNPNSVMRLIDADREGNEAYLLFLSPEFMSGLSFDLSVLQKSHFSPHRRVFALSPDKAVIFEKYMDMLYVNATVNPQNSIFVKNISRSLIAAMLYQLLQIADSARESFNERMAFVKGAESDDSFSGGTRRVGYVKAFLKLVHENYTRERCVGFYASKLFISPKYLSFLVKDVTGRSAAEWIDEYVILEAKNMLRFSGMNVQQVAYALNFTNQSAFGKYFKHLTGMSPTAFQKN